MRTVRQPNRSRGARDFLHRHAVLEVAQGEPAIFLRRGDPMQAERAHLGPQVARKQVVAVNLRGARRDSFSAKLQALSRIIAALSPRSKSKGRGALGIMGSLKGRASAAVGREAWRQSAAFGKARAGAKIRLLNGCAVLRAIEAYQGLRLIFLQRRNSQGGASERRRLSALMAQGGARKRGVSKHAPALDPVSAHGSVLRGRFAAPQDEVAGSYPTAECDN